MLCLAVPSVPRALHQGIRPGALNCTSCRRVALGLLCLAPLAMPGVVHAATLSHFEPSLEALKDKDYGKPRMKGGADFTTSTSGLQYKVWNLCGGSVWGGVSGKWPFTCALRSGVHHEGQLHYRSGTDSDQ